MLSALFDAAMKLIPLSPHHEPLVLVISRLLASDPTLLSPFLPEHLAYLKRHEEAGVYLFGGPLMAVDQQFVRDGMYILKVSDLEQAESIAKGDPFHREGLRRFELHIWQRKFERP